jgi:hypothetical protein
MAGRYNNNNGNLGHFTAKQIAERGRWQHKSTALVAHYKNQEPSTTSMDIHYWDKVIILKEGPTKNCTGRFVSVRVVNGVPKAMVEMSPDPDESTAIQMYSYDEIKKVIPPSLNGEDGPVVVMKEEAYNALIDDIEELAQQLKDLAHRVKSIKK